LIGAGAQLRWMIFLDHPSFFRVDDITREIAYLTARFCQKR